MKIWVLDKALSMGVYTMDAKIDEEGVAEGKRPGSPWTIFLCKDSYSTTREEAISMAETIRLRRIASLEKSLAKIRALKIEVPE